MKGFGSMGESKGFDAVSEAGARQDAGFVYYISQKKNECLKENAFQEVESMAELV